MGSGKKQRVVHKSGTGKPGLGLALLVGCGLAALGVWISLKPAPEKVSQSRPFVVPRTLGQLLALSPSDLARCDIALLNLLCAEGHGPTNSLDPDEALRRLDLMAGRIRMETERHLYRFKDHPEEFNRSEGQFRMAMLATVLQQDFKVRYNPARITEVGDFEPNDRFFADVRDVFIHGLLDDRRMGTCASLPVLHVALGRRLGYPLKLVATINHLFVRWEDANDRFNLDATGEGFHAYDDQHYREWPFPIMPKEEREFGYLLSMTPAQELSVFLGLRGHSLMVAGKPAEAIASHTAALRYAPESKTARLTLQTAQREAPTHPQPVFLPRDPVLQSQILTDPDPVSAQAELAAQRAIERSRANRGYDPGVPNTQPTSSPLQPKRP